MQPRNGGRDSLIDFIGVIAVYNMYELKARTREHVDKSGFDPARQHYRQAAVDADPPDMGNFPQQFQQLPQFVVRQCQRIAAAQYDLLQRGIGLQGFADIFPVSGFESGFVVGVGAAETIAAMDGASPGADQQSAPAVLLQQA